MKTSQPKNRRSSKFGVRLADPSVDHTGLAAHVRSKRKLPPPTLLPSRRPRRPMVPHRLLPTPLSRRKVRAARAMIVANVPTGRSGTSGMNASNGWSARVSARSGKVTPPAATDRGANAASVSIGPNVNSTTQSLSAAAPEGATSSRIRIPRSPSLPRSNSSLNRPTKSRLENERQGIGSPADRQMVVACANGTDADRCRRNYDGGICPPQWKTHDGRRPSGASWRCGYGCA